MAAAVVEVDIFLFFFLIVGFGLVTFIAIAFPFAEKRYWMGTLGRAEYRNKSGIVGVIKSPDGFVAIERMRFRFPGLLESLSHPPRMGRYFFAGKDSVLKPVGAVRLAFVDARDSLAGSMEAMALAAAVRGEFRSVSDAWDSTLEAKADAETRAEVAQRAAGRPGQPAAQGKSQAKRGYIFRRGGRARSVTAKTVPEAKDIEEQALVWAERRYYPATSDYIRRVPAKKSEDRVKMERDDPGGYGLWKQSYIDDQVEAFLYKGKRDTDMSVMSEIKNGVLRKTTSLDSYDIAQDGLTVVPHLSTVQEIQPLSKEARTAWFGRIFEAWAKDTAYWPIEVGGMVRDVSYLADFKLTNLGQGQVNDMLENEHNIVNDEQVGRDAHTLKMVMAAAILIVAMAVAAFILTKG